MKLVGVLQNLTQHTGPRFKTFGDRGVRIDFENMIAISRLHGDNQGARLVRAVESQKLFLVTAKNFDHAPAQFAIIKTLSDLYANLVAMHDGLEGFFADVDVGVARVEGDKKSKSISMDVHAPFYEFGRCGFGRKSSREMCGACLAFFPRALAHTFFGPVFARGSTARSAARLRGFLFFGVFDIGACANHLSAGSAPAVASRHN